MKFEATVNGKPAPCRTMAIHEPGCGALTEWDSEATSTIRCHKCGKTYSPRYVRPVVDFPEDDDSGTADIKTINTAKIIPLKKG